MAVDLVNKEECDGDKPSGAMLKFGIILIILHIVDMSCILKGIEYQISTVLLKFCLWLLFKCIINLWIYWHNKCMTLSVLIIITYYHSVSSLYLYNSITWPGFLLSVCAEPGAVRRLRLRQRRAGSVGQRGAEPPAQRRSVGVVLSARPGVPAGAPHDGTPIDHWRSPPPATLQRTSITGVHQCVSAVHYCCHEGSHLLHRSDYDKSTYGVSESLLARQTYVRWHRTFVIIWHQIFWQLVTSDKCHLSWLRVFFFLFRQNSRWGRFP